MGRARAAIVGRPVPRRVLFGGVGVIEEIRRVGAECHWQERKRKDMSIYYNKCSKSEGKLQALVPSASAMGRPEVRETK